MVSVDGASLTSSPEPMILSHEPPCQRGADAGGTGSPFPERISRGRSRRTGIGRIPAPSGARRADTAPEGPIRRVNEPVGAPIQAIAGVGASAARNVAITIRLMLQLSAFR